MPICPVPQRPELSALCLSAHPAAPASSVPCLSARPAAPASSVPCLSARPAAPASCPCRACPPVPQRPRVPCRACPPVLQRPRVVRAVPVRPVRRAASCPCRACPSCALSAARRSRPARPMPLAMAGGLSRAVYIPPRSARASWRSLTRSAGGLFFFGPPAAGGPCGRWPGRARGMVARVDIDCNRSLTQLKQVDSVPHQESAYLPISGDRSPGSPSPTARRFLLSAHAPLRSRSRPSGAPGTSASA